MQAGQGRAGQGRAGGRGQGKSGQGKSRAGRGQKAGQGMMVRNRAVQQHRAGTTQGRYKGHGAISNGAGQGQNAGQGKGPK